MTNGDSITAEADLTDHQHPGVRSLGEIVGEDLLAFMLAMNPADLRDEDPVLDEARAAISEAIWRKAAENTEQIKGSGHRNPWKALKKEALIKVFCKYDETLDSSVASEFHVRSGGIRPAVDEPSSLEGCLQTIAVDCFAARLIGTGQTHYTPGVANRHPLMPTVHQHLRDAAEPLTQLFRAAFAATDASDRPGVTESTYTKQMLVEWSTGDGGSLEMRDIGTNIVCSLFLEEDLGDQVLVHVAEAVRDGLDRGRRLAAGETVLVKTLIGLGDVSLTRGVAPVEIAGGRIRRPTVLDQRANPFAAEPHLILELDRTVRYNEVRLSPPPVSDRHELLSQFVADNERRKKLVPDPVSSTEELTETIRRVRFAMLLASPDEKVLRPVWRFSRHVNPLTSSGSGSHQPNPSPGVVHTQLPPAVDAAAAAEIAEWATRMAELPDSLKVGRRRLLQATTERADPVDSFIDAVVAWESMFGTKAETAFRVTGSMALLLEPTDVAARKPLHKRLTDLYSHRSDLVHGTVGHDLETKQFKLTDVPEYTRDAVRYAIDCFKRILSDANLKPLDSAARSKRVILGI
ncbi:HEPN domain-containing protein [Nocardia abscessus]|uniref:HEPN domain-containing protein n=1 Tax=Nocardia abscessus TaxID=120957 RepID=UPI00245662A7|nr:HEPN domain-containing protein [Nocardia abscessus]